MTDDVQIWLFDKLQWMTTGVMVMLFQKHFDSTQYESHRQDGLQKLRCDAVPMVFVEESPTVVETVKLVNQKHKQSMCQIFAIVFKV